MPDDPQIVLSGIRKSFGKVEVIKGVDLSIAPGEFVSLLGASGCGKTTLLRIVAGLETVSAGTVSIAGQDVTQLPPERRDIAMMFQSYALLPHLSVAENVRFPLRMRGIGNRQEQAEKVRTALETVQMTHLADRRPRQLSGGQQQRVALARAIVTSPKVLLLDEPLSNLDARLREDMQVELMELHRRLGLTTIFVTHDQEEALSLSDRIVLINNGGIEQMGAPKDIYAAPRTAFASDFLGAANLIKADVRESGDTRIARLVDGQMLAGLDPAIATGPQTLMVRQEDIALAPAGAGGLAARVETRIYLGARIRYVLRLGEDTLRALTGAEADFAPGTPVSLNIVPSQVRAVAR